MKLPMRDLMIWLRPRWLWLALLASVLMLAVAHAFQAAGYRPCALCYTQRHVYWGAIAISVLALGAHAALKSPLALRVGAVLLGVAFLAGTTIAAYHAGVEWKFWPGPKTCSNLASGAVTANDIAAALGRKIIVVPCDEAAWRDPILRLSMAGWNALGSAALAACSWLAAAAPLPVAVEEE